MTWADSVPNLLIGLREGLEAGLVVSILLAALRKGPRVSSAPVWLGVLGAVMLSGSFAAVLSFSAGVLSSRAQEAVSGLLSVFAVGLVTAMVFWMRRTAAGLAAHLRGEVARAAAIGAGALTLTAFLAVGREGLETTLFLWTAARASGQTAGPLLGAAIGLGAAVSLCWLLYRRAVRLNVGTFFNRTAIALIVIAAGVLAYGLGDLQDAGLLTGERWIAFDLTAHADPGSWWVSLITGVTDLSPKMTVLQVAAWLVYLGVVVPLFVAAGRAAAATRAAAAPVAATQAAPVAATQAAPVAATQAAPVAAAQAARAAPAAPASTAGRWEGLAGHRPWAVAGVLVVGPAVAAGMTIAALPAASSAAAATVTVTDTGCARDWTSATAGARNFTVVNRSALAGEITLDDASGAIVGEIETLGPGTTARLSATLGGGTYTFACRMGGKPVMASEPVQVTAAHGTAAHRTTATDPVAVKPVTLGDLAGPNRDYEAYAARTLDALASAVTAVKADLRGGDLAAARRDWLTAQLDWERVGASYNSFGDLGVAVDGLPDGLPGGAGDKRFTGLHRLEYGLWHGQSAAELLPVAAALAENVTAVRRNLTSDDLAGDPANLPVRAHEILEDALRDHLSGMDDQGGGAAFAQTYADTEVTRAVLGYLTPMLNSRQPGLAATAMSQLDALRRALLAARANGTWRSPGTVSLTVRQRVDGSTGALLETLASVPDLLELPPTH